MKEYYVCLACGKFGEDKYGKNGSHGWDVSCYLNSVLVREDKIVWNESKTGVIEILE